MTTVFVPAECRDAMAAVSAANGFAGLERRVAQTPATVKKLVQHGFEVLLESGAGLGACFTDEDFQAAGAQIVTSAEEGLSRADILLQVGSPSVERIAKLKEGANYIGFVDSSEQLLEAFQGRKASIFSMAKIPRISRAQKHDALSSQANLAGYQAVLLAANECPKIFPLLMTAAGTMRPARVVILGAGVAGLQAIATAKRLGALVEVSDVRPAVKEQVESLGATFIEVPSDEDLETAGGYAKEASAEFLAKQAQITRERICKADVVISSALVHGKRAPVLIKADVVEDMKPGSVIVDMAAEQGGNCELTRAGQRVVEHGVVIVGALNLPSMVAEHASEAYAKNLLNVIEDQLTAQKKAAKKAESEAETFEQAGFVWNFDDEVVTSALVMYRGEKQDTHEVAMRVKSETN